MRRAIVALALCVGAVPVGAQEDATVPCRGQRVDSIAIDAQAPTVTGLQRVPVVGNVARSVHVVTRPEIIRGFLLIEVGDRCSELRRAESERILRAQPFLADVAIDARPSAEGGVIIDVRTTDDLSLIASGSVAGHAPQVRALRVGSGNLGGLGVSSSIAWRHHPALDDRLELRLADHQFAGRRLVLNALSLKEPLGRDDRAELLLPFRTDLQRTAWRMLIGEGRGHAQFVERDSGRLVLGYGREYAEAGGMVRVGAPGRLTLLGVSFTNERAWPDSAPRRLTDDGFADDTAALFAGRFMETRAARVNALVGLRAIRYMRVRGFDALRGTQDVPVGVQLGTLVGRAVPVFGANSNDLFVASDLYVGFGNPRLAYRLQMQAEGRRLRGSGAWDNFVGSGRLSRYSRIGDRRTRIYSIEWSGTGRLQIPHALSLGLPNGGVRGFGETVAVGGRRGIARLDEHIFVGTPFDYGDFGLAWFADAGQLWAGDLPYGSSTRLRASAGLGMLLAVPRRSTRMWRLEVAVPINPEVGARRWEVRLSRSDRTTFFWREPSDVDMARARAVPSSIYSWP